MDSLVAKSFIEFAEDISQYELPVVNDSLLFGSNNWYLKETDIERAWSVNKGNNNIPIAIIDDVFYYNHPDLINNLYTNPNEIPNNGIDDDGNGYIDDVHGWDVADDDNEAGPDNKNPIFNNYAQHGTQTAAIACATPNNNIGSAGSGYNTTFIPIKTRRAVDSSNSNASLVSYILWKGMIYAANSNATIICPSFYNRQIGPGSIVEDSIVNYIKNKGKIIVAAAGNDNNDLSYPLNPTYKVYPCGYDGAFCVGATRPFGERAHFSNYDTFADIDIMAPGIHMVGAHFSDAENYKYFSGTSASIPFVSGVAALVKSQNPSFTGTDIENRLKSTAHDIDYLNPGLEGKLGYGLVDAYGALINKKLKTIEFKTFSRSGFVNDVSSPKTSTV